VQTRGQRAKNLPSVEEPSKGDDDTFETLTKLKGSSDSKTRKLLEENLMKDEDDEDLSEEGSGELINEKGENDEYYLDDEDYEDDEDYDDDEDVYDDEDEEYSGDDEYDDDDDYDDEEEDYEEEEDYINKGSKKATVTKDLKKKEDKKDDKSSTPKSAPIPSIDDDLHFADDEETGKDLNLSDDEHKQKNPTKNGEILYEYYNEFFEEDEEDYEEEDLNAQVEDAHQFTKKPTRPSIKKETVPSRSIPSYFENLSTSHLLLMGASALISFILFTIAFVVCCHQKQQKKKYGNMPFVIDSNLLSKSSQKSHHPSNFVLNSSTSIVKNYQRVPTSTREFLSDSTSTSCSSGLENPNHLPVLMDVGSGETKKPLLP
jgi:hypothetical protein